MIVDLIIVFFIFVNALVLVDSKGRNWFNALAIGWMLSYLVFAS